MTAQELNTYIDKVLGNSIRCLLPSYWWKRILSQIVGYVESVDKSKASIKDVNIIDDKIVLLEQYVRNKSFVVITTGDSGSVIVEADGVDIEIQANSTKKIHFLERFEVSERQSNIINVDTSSIYTSNVTDMSSMFNDCSALTSLDLSNFDTSNVTNMSYMFRGCYELPSLDLSNFDTSKVTSMFYMFYRCRKLTSLDVSNFDTSNMTLMSSMFYDCSALTSLDVSNFDTSKVTDMSFMFYGCRKLASLDLSNFDTSKVTDMDGMFGLCAVTSLDLSNFDTSKVTDMKGMFYMCAALPSLDVSNFDTSNVTDMNSMFYMCAALTSLDVSNFDTSNVIDMNEMFYYCKSLTTLSLGEGFFKTSQVTEVDFSDLGNWSQESFIQSVVTNSYDRASNGLPNITIKLHANTYAYLTDEHKATLTSKGYDVVSV